MLQTNHDGTKILGDEKSISDQISIHSDYITWAKNPCKTNNHRAELHDSAPISSEESQFVSILHYNNTTKYTFWRM